MPTHTSVGGLCHLRVGQLWEVTQMTRPIMGRMALKMVLGVAVAGLLAVPTTRSALAEDGPGSQPGFVLLSMEQAPMYRGTQIPGTCTGTATYGHCSGSSASCSDYSGENCPDFARTFTQSPPRYCTGWAPAPPPGGCTFMGVAWCYTDFQCQVDPQWLTCYHPSWPFGYEYRNEINDDVCTTPTPGPSPVPLPPPQGE
jgi:hypothetical protein